MDFGIARAAASSSQTMTQTAAVIGTAQYLSPEQARGEHVDARSDLYSTGCLLYELLTGFPPFPGDSPVSVAYQHVREDPVPPSQHRPVDRRRRSTPSCSRRWRRTRRTATRRPTRCARTCCAPAPGEPVEATPLLPPGELLATTTAVRTARRPARVAERTHPGAGVRPVRAAAARDRAGDGPARARAAQRPAAVRGDPRRGGPVAAGRAAPPGRRRADRRHAGPAVRRGAARDGRRAGPGAAHLAGGGRRRRPRGEPGRRDDAGARRRRAISRQEAVAQLEQAGLEVERVVERDGDDPAGQVLEVLPGPGSEVRADSEVSLVVASGEVDVPARAGRGGAPGRRGAARGRLLGRRPAAGGRGRARPRAGPVAVRRHRRAG